MEPAQVARLAGYLLAAACAGRATSRDWQAWADRIIAAGEVDTWILDVRLATTFDHLRSSLQPIYQRPLDVEAIVGHVWIRHVDGERNFGRFLHALTRGAYPSDVQRELQLLSIGDLYECDGMEEFEKWASGFVKERRLVGKAQNQWRTLFPDDANDEEASDA